LSPEGNTVYAIDTTTYPIFHSVVAIDLGAGQQKQVFRTDGDIPMLAVSPDGRTLALMIFTGSGERSQGELALIGVDGSNFRNLYTAAPGELHNPINQPGLRWTKDGRTILFPRNRPNGWELMRMPTEGGKPESTGLTGRHIIFMDLSSDGSQIAFGDAGPG